MLGWNFYFKEVNKPNKVNFEDEDPDLYKTAMVYVYHLGLTISSRLRLNVVKFRPL